MSARSEHIIISDNHRRCFQIAPTVAAQTADVGVFHFGEIDSEHCQVVFADGAQQVVDAPRLHHPVVLLLTVDGRAARVGEVTR